MSPHAVKGVLAGAGAAVFFTVARISGVDSFFLFFALLPLCVAGFRFGFSSLLAAICTATIVIVVLAGPASALLFVVLLAGPLLLFIPQSMTIQVEMESGQARWYPMGRILTDVTFYAALVFVAIAFHYAPEGGLEALFREGLNEAFSVQDPVLQKELLDIMDKALPLLPAALIWWWVLVFYAHAALAQLIERRLHSFARASFALEPFVMQGWMLPLLAASAALSLFWEGEASFTLEVLSLIFLLPYFLLGISIIHQFTRSWPNRLAVLGALYLLMVFTVWPAAVIATLGIWRQCSGLGKPAA